MDRGSIGIEQAMQTTLTVFDFVLVTFISYQVTRFHIQYNSKKGHHINGRLELKYSKYKGQY
jgi:hypothetical protein